MPHFLHGSSLLEEQPKSVAASAAGTDAGSGVAITVTAVPQVTRFDFLYPTLADNEPSGLPEGRDTVADLIALGRAMDEDNSQPSVDSAIPSIQTYFGQFVAHDITWERATESIQLDNNVQPWTLEKIRATLSNSRTSRLDLDSVYGDGNVGEFAPRDDDGRLQLREVIRDIGRPPNKDAWNDLPRAGKLDTKARIGDPRNDENLIISQLHVAFLRAHNAIMQEHYSFDEARRILTQHYQYLVIHDFLERITHPQVFAELEAQPDYVYQANADDLFIPLEFSAAAYRFGHSMIRRTYETNLNFPAQYPLELAQMFRFLAGYPGLPESWIVEWEPFLDGGNNSARQIDTKLVEPLSKMLNSEGQVFSDQARLAVRDLLRGYILRIPTGQAIADKLGVKPLTADEIKSAVPEAQQEVLDASVFLLERTPLWFYVLAEAAYERNQNSTEKVDYLGQVGSYLVAGVLFGLILNSAHSVLATPGWTPTFGGKLEDLFALSANYVH